MNGIQIGAVALMAVGAAWAMVAWWLGRSGTPIAPDAAAWPSDAGVPPAAVPWIAEMNRVCTEVEATDLEFRAAIVAGDSPYQFALSTKGQSK